MARASSSLPVPVSPSSSTLASVPATCSILREYAAQQLALADDFVETVRAGDFLLKIDVLGPQPVGEPLDLGKRSARV